MATQTFTFTHEYLTSVDGISALAQLTRLQPGLLILVSAQGAPLKHDLVTIQYKMVYFGHRPWQNWRVTYKDVADPVVGDFEMHATDEHNATLLIRTVIEALVAAYGEVEYRITLAD